MTSHNTVLKFVIWRNLTTYFTQPAEQYVIKKFYFIIYFKNKFYNGGSCFNVEQFNEKMYILK